MNVALLFPGALFALAAILIPLLIHLSRRSEQRITDFAALRWLSAKLRPQRKIVFQEILLLLLRLLLLITLAFFLAKPVSWHNASPKHWVMLTPGVDIAAAKKQLPDQNTQWHWLSAGFPDIETAVKPSEIAMSSLLRDLDSQLPANTQITVFVPEQLSGLDGERIQLSRKIDWRVLPGKMPTTKSPTVASPIHLAIRYDEKHRSALRYFNAAFAAWEMPSSTIDIASSTSPLKQNSTHLIWLSSEEIPEPIREWTTKGHTLMLAHDAPLEISASTPIWRNKQGAALLHRAVYEQGKVLRWQQDISPSMMPILLEPHFAEHLRDAFDVDTRTHLHSRAFAASQTPYTGATRFIESPKLLSAWLIILMMALFTLERWLANSPHRWSAA